MNRRAYLAVVGTVLTAGCSTRASSPTPTPSPAPTPEPPPRIDGRFDPAGTHETVDVGSREQVDDPDQKRPHNLKIWNDASEARALTVAVTRVTGTSWNDGETLLEDTYSVPGDEIIEVGLLEPGAYAVSIDSPDDGTSETITVGRDTFDCNFSQTQVRVAPDGTITADFFTTTMGCGGE